MGGREGAGVCYGVWSRELGGGLPWRYLFCIHTRCAFWVVWSDDMVAGWGGWVGLGLSLCFVYGERFFVTL